MVIDTNPPLTGSTILSYLSSSHELPIRSSVRSVLGKIFRYCGNGKDPVVDRIYVREKIREVMVKYQYLIKGIEVKVPSSVLHGGRKEIIILSGIHYLFILFISFVKTYLPFFNLQIQLPTGISEVHTSSNTLTQRIWYCWLLITMD